MTGQIRILCVVSGLECHPDLTGSSELRLVFKFDRMISKFPSSQNLSVIFREGYRFLFKKP